VKVTPVASAPLWTAFGAPGLPGGLEVAALNVAVTAVGAVTVTLHAPVPAQAPLQPAKVEPADAEQHRRQPEIGKGGEA